MIYRYLSLMKFGNELRWGLESSFYELSGSDLEKNYVYLIPISKEMYKKLNEKFYESEKDND